MSWEPIEEAVCGRVLMAFFDRFYNQSVGTDRCTLKKNILCVGLGLCYRCQCTGVHLRCPKQFKIRFFSIYDVHFQEARTYVGSHRALVVRSELDGARPNPQHLAYVVSVNG